MIPSRRDQSESLTIVCRFLAVELMGLSRKCVVCGDTKGELHIYHPEWRQRLLAHCNDEGKKRLDAQKPKIKYVCHKHFTEDFRSKVMDPQKSLSFISTEFCGPYYTSRIENETASGPQRSRKRSEPSSSRQSDSMENKRNSTLSSSTEDMLSQSQAKFGAHESAETSINWDVSFCRSLDDLLNTFAVGNSEEKEELLRRYIFGSDIGQFIILGAMFSVVENFVEKLQPWEARRPVLNALFRTMESLNLKANDHTISKATGISDHTTAEARDEHDEVRTLHFQSTVLPFLTHRRCFTSI